MNESNHNLWKYDENQSDFDVWIENPTKFGWINYSIIIPIICFMGIIGNAISVKLLRGSQMNDSDSFFIYLQYLAIVNLGSCLTMMFSSLINGFFWNNNLMTKLESCIFLPLGNLLSYMGSSISLALITDRFFLLRRIIRLKKPNFCEKTIAKKTCFAITILIIIISVPFVFIYKISDRGHVKYNNFYKSKFYRTYAWLVFVNFTLIPAVLILIFAALLLLSLKKALEVKRKLTSCISNGYLKRRKQQNILSISLSIIVILLIIGEIPSQLVSRYMASSILFNGNFEAAKNSIIIEYSRQFTTLLSAINVSSNFPLYCKFCPKFEQSLKYKINSTFKRSTNKKNRQMCRKLKCIEQGICDCDFLIDSISNVLVKNTIEIMFKIVELNSSFNNKK